MVASDSPGMITGPFCDRNLENPAGGRRQHRALLHLLGDHVAIRAHGLQRPVRDVERGLRIVELHLRADAALLQFEGPVVIGLRLVALRLLRFDAGVDRLLLQNELRVHNDGDRRACRDLIPFLDGERRYRAADPRASGEFVDGLDRPDDRLLVRDRRAMDDKGRGQGRDGRQQERRDKESRTHGQKPA